MDNPEVDPYKYSLLTFDKGAKAIQWKKTGFATNGARTAGHPHAKKYKDFILFTEMNSEWII
jgi:hypothetical protein